MSDKKYRKLEPKWEELGKPNSQQQVPALRNKLLRGSTLSAIPLQRNGIKATIMLELKEMGVVRAMMTLIGSRWGRESFKWLCMAINLTPENSSHVGSIREKGKRFVSLDQLISSPVSSWKIWQVYRLIRLNGQKCSTGSSGRGAAFLGEALVISSALCAGKSYVSTALP